MQYRRDLFPGGFSPGQKFLFARAAVAIVSAADAGTPRSAGHSDIAAVDRKDPAVFIITVIAADTGEIVIYITDSEFSCPIPVCRLTENFKTFSLGILDPFGSNEFFSVLLNDMGGIIRRCIVDNTVFDRIIPNISLYIIPFSGFEGAIVYCGRAL